MACQKQYRAFCNNILYEVQLERVAGEADASPGTTRSPLMMDDVMILSWPIAEGSGQYSRMDVYRICCNFKGKWESPQANEAAAAPVCSSKGRLSLMRPVRVLSMLANPTKRLQDNDARIRGPK